VAFAVINQDLQSKPKEPTQRKSGPALRHQKIGKSRKVLLLFLGFSIYCFLSANGGDTRIFDIPKLTDLLPRQQIKSKPKVRT
jgi:hypothetical protein